jgi:hypothetical protein
MERKKMSSGFEDSYVRILARKERGKPEKRGRKKKQRAPDLGDTNAGRANANAYRRPEPMRVEVPAEFLEPQPPMTRPILGAFIGVKSSAWRRGRR